MIKLKNILSISSEDNDSKAENLLNNSGKWLGAKDGETSQFVRIQLEEPSSIKEIDIENESSAFIEILVGNLKDSEDDYECLLPATSFMSPNESKTSINTKRVKIFTNETNLDKNVSNKKWQVVKIVCTQPFNSELQFGVSSIKFYNEITNENAKDAAKINTGVFSLKKDLSIGQESKKDNDASKTNETKTESVYEKWKREKETNESENKEESNNLKRKLPETDDDEKEKKVNKTSPKKHELVNNHKKVPTEQILRGVVFALSGFQNPLRSEIRDAGLKLGAKYRPDWTDDCTHLVCAYSNTPKAAQVRKSGGTIVTKDWIFDCKKEKQNLDCDDYKLADDSSDEDKPRKAARNAKKNLKKINKKDEFDDSYDEEEAENSDDKDFIVDSDEEDDIISSSSEEKSTSSDTDDSVQKKKSKKTKKHKKVKKDKKKKEKKKSKKSSSSSSSSSDSETDLEEYMKKKQKEILKETKKTIKTNVNKKKEISYESSDDEKKKDTKKLKKTNSSSSNKTDANSDMEVDENKNWEFPTFFENIKFFIHGDFDAKKRKQLSKIIFAYGGEVNDYMSTDVAYVITDKKWNKEFQESLDENPKLKFIEPDWLDTCHRRKKLIPYDVFEINKD